MIIQDNSFYTPYTTSKKLEKEALDKLKSSKENPIKEDEIKDPKTPEDYQKIVKQTKQAAKEALLGNILPGQFATKQDTMQSRKDELFKSRTESIDKLSSSLNEQLDSLRGRLSTSNFEKRDELKAHMTFVQNQLSSLGLKKLSLMREHAGMKS